MTDLGLGPSFVGLLASLWSQSAMSESLRIGVHPSERTVLVTTGPFRRVRNPIYSAMLLYVVGVAALIPVARASSLSGFSRSQSTCTCAWSRSLIWRRATVAPTPAMQRVWAASFRGSASSIRQPLEPRRSASERWLGECLKPSWARGVSRPAPGRTAAHHAYVEVPTFDDDRWSPRRT
jgi:hypothetical protein